MTRDEKRIALESAGFKVGYRDHRLNTDFTGRFMVAEAYEDSETPTQDGRDGPWCVVGDDLADLIDKGFYYLESLR